MFQLIEYCVSENIQSIFKFKATYFNTGNFGKRIYHYFLFISILLRHSEIGQSRYSGYPSYACVIYNNLTMTPAKYISNILTESQKILFHLSQCFPRNSLD